MRWDDPRSHPLADMRQLVTAYLEAPPTPPWVEGVDGLFPGVLPSDPERECGVTPDAAPYDLFPDDCWSCDEQPAMDDFGLCASCKVALR